MHETDRTHAPAVCIRSSKDSRRTALIGSGWKLIEWTTGNRSLFNLHFDIGRTKDLHAKQSLPSL